jgi:hypothetical protein
MGSRRVAGSLGRIWVPASSVQTATTDIATITMPATAYAGAGYLPIRFFAYGASTSLTLATVDLRTAAGGGGSAIISAQPLSALTGGSLMVALTLALATTIQTATTLTIRCVTGQAAPATCKFGLEYLVAP